MTEENTLYENTLIVQYRRRLVLNKLYEGKTDLVKEIAQMFDRGDKYLATYTSKGSRVTIPMERIKGVTSRKIENYRVEDESVGKQYWSVNDKERNYIRDPKKEEAKEGQLYQTYVRFNRETSIGASDIFVLEGDKDIEKEIQKQYDEGKKYLIEKDEEGETLLLPLDEIYNVETKEIDEFTGRKDSRIVML